MSTMTRLDTRAKRAIMRILHTDRNMGEEKLLELVANTYPGYPRALVEEHIQSGLSTWEAPKRSRKVASDDQPYRIEAREGGVAGRAIVATRKIQAGEVVLAEQPLVIVDPFNVEESRAKIDALSTTMSADDLELLNQLPTVPEFAPLARSSLEAAVLGNLLPTEPLQGVGLVGVPLHLRPMGLFLHISLAPHSCGPNAHHLYAGHLGKRILHAVRDIDEGEVITISRSTLLAPSVERHREHSLGGREATCPCQVCAKAPADLATSDARRLEARRIRNGTTTASDPWGHLDLMDTAFHLMLAEGLMQDVSWLAEDAYQVAYTTGQFGKARGWAKRYCDYTPIPYGQLCSVACAKFAEFADKPRFLLRPEMEPAVSSWLALGLDGASIIPGEHVPRWVAERILAHDRCPHHPESSSSAQGPVHDPNQANFEAFMARAMRGLSLVQQMEEYGPALGQGRRHGRGHGRGRGRGSRGGARGGGGVGSFLF